MKAMMMLQTRSSYSSEIQQLREPLSGRKRRGSSAASPSLALRLSWVVLGWV